MVTAWRFVIVLVHLVDVANFLWRSLLGPYEILVPIGAGGMGEVYKARDTRLERTVAIESRRRKQAWIRWTSRRSPVRLGPSPR